MTASHARFVYIGHPDTPAELDVIYWDERQRLVRALQGLGLCWAAAVAAVFLPLLHFILVPSLLIAGPVYGFMRYGERATVVAARGRCPACGEPLAVKLGQGARRRLPVRCEACRRSITLEMNLAQPTDFPTPAAS